MSRSPISSERLIRLQCGEYGIGEVAWRGMNMLVIDFDSTHLVEEDRAAHDSVVQGSAGMSHMADEPTAASEGNGSSGGRRPALVSRLPQDAVASSSFPSTASSVATDGTSSAAMDASMTQVTRDAVLELLRRMTDERLRRKHGDVHITDHMGRRPR